MANLKMNERLAGNNGVGYKTQGRERMPPSWLSPTYVAVPYRMRSKASSDIIIPTIGGAG